jgi:twitching motility two-component system response regulator PilG
LTNEKVITREEATKLAESLTQEVLEACLAVPSVRQKNWTSFPLDFRQFTGFDVSLSIQTCQKRLKLWRAFGEEVVSPWQRPYLFINTYAQKNLSDEQIKKLGKILKGYSFYHLAALLNQDEIQLVQKIYPLIKNKAVLLREPQPPFNRLPVFYDRSTANQAIIRETDKNITGDFSDIVRSNLPNKVWQIACIDDSQTMLNEMKRFLDAENFVVHTIKDSLKALMQVIRIKPDLILLDVSMPDVDGYKLCSLIRKNSAFKTIPIIMVTAKTGLLDRARARVSGASDYMTKPFTQEELLKMVFRYLS